MAEKPQCKSGRTGGCVMSRRRFVAGSALGIASASAVAAAALAEEATKPYEAFKGSKESAGYIQKSEPSPQDCSTCHSFIDPDECVLVEGPVSPLGWCNWYSD